ncbi:hypothetical protein ACHAXN_000164, partial [Cyclotella atomus]
NKDPVLKDELPWDPDPSKVGYNKLLLENFFPCPMGIAKTLDDFLCRPAKDPKLPNEWKARVERDNILFHREGNYDPVKLVKMCLTLMVASVLEVHSGIENLWKQGKSDGYKDYPNYGQHIPIDYFKVFLHGFPYLWANRKYWDVPKKDLPFDFLVPFVDQYKGLRKNMLRCLLGQWTMIRNAVECATGIFVNHDIVDTPNVQWLKKYLDPPTKSHLPRGEDVSYHTAEVLRQAEDPNLIEGGWVGGDAYFGSMQSCVELKRRLGAYSPFIIKQNVNFYPMKVLHAIMAAPAGSWVVMTATIDGVDLYVMAYAWSSKGVAYMVSSCGETVMDEQAYLSRYEDEYMV